MRRLLALCACLWTLHVSAGELINASVEHRDKRYFIEIDMRIKADPARVYALLTDYNHLKRLNGSIELSELMFSLDERTHRVKVVTDACVMFFCKTLTQVQDVEQVDEHVVIATVIPQQSDFEYAHARWAINAEHGMTRVTFNADLKPAFWVPPLIGPPLIKDKLYDEGIATIEALERLAGQDDTAAVQ